MKRTFRHGLVLAAAVAMLAGAPTAWAACTFESQQIWHGLSGSIINCPDAAPVIAYAYAMSSPTTINSAGQDVACNDGSVTLGTNLPCQPEAGTPGDGAVTVYYEWGSGNPGSAGCPNPDQAGEDPVALQLVCNNGASILATVGFFDQTYTLELATLDCATMEPTFDNGPTLVNLSDAGASWTVGVNVPTPTAFSDCDPASCANQNSIDLCTVPRPDYLRGRVYTRTAPCGTSPDPRVSSGWVLAATPDAGGAATISVAKPSDPANCAFVGATATLAGVETAAIVGSFQLTTEAASNDKVKIDGARFEKGKVIVDFSTTNETSIVGFNVYSDSTKLNGSLIPARGAGSNPYVFEVGRGALKGGKSVLVEAVKSNQTVERTAPVALK